MTSQSKPLFLLAVLAVAVVASIEAASAKQSKAAVKATQPKAVADSYHLSCPDEPGWAAYNGKCYKKLEAEQYWYNAEQACRSYGGHLVSINSQKENTFVSKLTTCQPVWTGGYAVSVDKLSDPTNYRYTDGSVIVSGGYFPHNVSSIDHIHEPLLELRDLHLQNRVYHAKAQPLCEISSPPSNQTNDCPQGWQQLDENCYKISQFTTGYIEGLHHCRRDNATLVSVRSEDELTAINLLDLDTHECSTQVWIGLTKLHQKRTRYEWYDDGDEHQKIPAWATGHPLEGYQNGCVSLKDGKIMTVPCANQYRFVCKKPAN